MKLTFLGANRNVTGSRYCLEANGHRVMIDCGLVQEREFLGRNWEPCSVAADEVTSLLVTHAHLDHIGLIPRFVNDGFNGRIYATRPSVALAKVLLEDSAKIQAEDARYKRRRHRKEGRTGPHPVVPLYTGKDVTKALKMFRGVDYDTPKDVAPGIVAIWRDAGHILGSASLEIVVKEHGRQRTIVFSGDIGRKDKPLVADPSGLCHADFVVMEATYGDRGHVSEGQLEERLEEILLKTLNRGGNVVIPVFAVERAQEMMYLIGRLAHRDRIPDVPIYLDSPMACDVTDVFRKFEDWLDEETRAAIESDEPPLHFPGLKMTRTSQQSMAINRYDGPCIIMASAGMCNAGRIKHHLRMNISRPESTILLVGFQAHGTLGRRIADGEPEVRIHGRHYRVEAEVVQLFGMSGHADREGLLQWIGQFADPPKQVFLTHGEEAAALALEQAIRQKYGYDVSVPRYGDSVELRDDAISVGGGEDEAVEAVASQSTSDPAAAPPADDAEPASQPAPSETSHPPSAEHSGQERQHPDFEFLDSTVRRTTGFLYDDPWRVLRIQSDTIQGIETMARALHGRRRAISVFGSSRLPESDPAYQLTRETCRKLGQCGFAIITGGGPGIMEAANRGAQDAGTVSIGLNIELPHEQSLNDYCDVSYECHYFFVRKMLFAKYAHGFLIFPGGFGTLDELFEALTLIQTEKVADFPVVLADSSYWEPLLAWLRDSMLGRGCISDFDLDRFTVLDDPDAIAKALDARIQ